MMLNIYSFKLDDLLSRNTDAIHFNYYLNKDSDSQKDFLEKSGIPRSSFLLAKKEKFLNSDKLNKKIKECYNIKDYDSSLVDELTELISEAYTLLHYDSSGLMKEYYEKFINLYNNTSNTLIEILSLIGLCLSSDLHKNKVDISSWDYKIELLKLVYNDLDITSKYIVLYAIINFYANVHNQDMIIKYCREMEEITGLPDELSILASFNFMTAARLQKNHLLALRHMKKAEELCNIYYSEYLNQALRGIRSTLYLLCKEYELCIKYSLGEVIRLQREDKSALSYVTSLHNLSSCYLKINNYNESLKYTNHILNYDIVNNTNIPQAYHSVLESKRELGFMQKMYCYLKMNELQKLNDLYNSLNVSDDVMLVANTIILLSKKEYKNFVKNLNELKTKNNLFIGWLELFEEEYKSYLIKTKKYVSIYDMKV